MFNFGKKKKSTTSHLVITLVIFLITMLAGLTTLVFLKERSAELPRNSAAFPFLSFIPVWIAAKSKTKLSKNQRVILILGITFFAIFLAVLLLTIGSGRNLTLISILPFLVIIFAIVVFTFILLKNQTSNKF
jgi:hypothetical protein